MNSRKQQLASKIVLLVAALLCTLGGFSQRKSKFPFAWPESFSKPATIGPTWSNYEAVMPEERNKIIINGHSTDYIWIKFKKQARIKFETEAAIQAHQKTTLPESYDPSYDWHDVPLVGREKRHRPLYYNIKVEYFKARIIKPDGREVAAEIKKSVGNESNVFDKVRNTYYFYHYEVTNLEPGDELQFAYAYELPYDINWFKFNSARIFFNGEIPKQDYQLIVTAPDKLFNDFKGAVADSVVVRDKVRRRYWHRSQLTGSINEPGAKPYKELEHIVYYLNTDNLRYQYVDPQSGVAINGNYWLYLIRRRESRAFWIKRVAKKRIGDRQNDKVDRFIEKSTAGIAIEEPLERAIKMHQKVAETFDYQSDDAYIAGIDRKLERMGDFTEDKVIRQISRYNLYAKLFSRVGLNYNTTYFMDRRIGEMSEQYISPLYDNEFAFAFDGQNRLKYMYPKRSRFGLHVDEFPFYWEDSPAFFVNVFDIFSRDFEQLNFVRTPKSDDNVNVRNSNMLVKVRTDNGLLDCQARIHLSGQFSTMTRGAYLYDHQDSTINPKYYQRIYDVQNARVATIEQTGFQKEFPFRTGLNIDYALTKKVLVGKESIDINIENWFNHIYLEGFSSKNRTLAYYPDFMFQDEIKYVLEFDEPVAIDEATAQAVQLNGAYGTYTFTITQLDDKHVELRSYFHINRERIEANSVSDVSQVYGAIEALNQKVLHFKRLR